MTFNKVKAGLLVLACASGIAVSQTVLAGQHTTLPSQATKNAIMALPDVAKSQSGALKPDYRELKVNLDRVPPTNLGKFTFDNEGNASVPFVAPNSMILQFEPDVSESAIQDFLKGRNLEVVRTFPKIGAIQVKTDLSRYFHAQLGDNDANQILLRGLVRAIEDFQSDPRVRSATPDLLLRDQNQHGSSDMQITNILTPSDVVLSNPANPTEKTDWGIADIEADQLWDMPGARDGVLFGVMDVGFARHEDLTFLEFPPDIDVDNHGNHVAAIACGRHDNDRGVRGVLPNCFVRARSGDVFFDSDEGGPVLDFIVLFSQVLATLERFVDAQDDIHTFNVSLGYNWRSNFGINPDLPESALWRTLVASQGAILVSLLELADQNGKVIFSAAGNDSSGLATPIGAKFASPFNWAAVTAREAGLAQNGVIVEAHDASGRLAGFSNTGGNISCPGVNIFSAVAFDAKGQPSDSAYGKMSGTSMASPYCAAGHLLFRLVRPGYSGVEAVDCMRQSSDLSSSDTPMLRLKKAIGVCPIRN